MSIKRLTLTTAALALFACEAIAQANHNTSRSNKTSGGVASPVDTGEDNAETSEKTAADSVGHVTLIKRADGGDATGNETADAEADNKPIAPANHNTSRSNKTPGGVAAPADTGEANTETSEKAETDSVGHVTLIKKADGGDATSDEVAEAAEDTKE